MFISDRRKFAVIGKKIDDANALSARIAHGKNMRLTHRKILGRAAGALVFALVGASLLHPGQARAQAVIASINGDPVTSYDVEERARLLRALGQPSSPQAAFESLVQSRLKAGEVNKYGIHISPNELGPTMNAYADKAHMSVAQLSQRIAAAHIDPKHVENFLSIEQAFALYARARNRAVEVSSADINAEMSRDKSIGRETSYTLRQVVIIVTPDAGGAGLESAAKELENLRSRWTDCASGPKIATATGRFVVRDPVTRTSSQLGPEFTALLDKTPIGHLTPPSRNSTGLVSIAVCDRKAGDKDSAKDLAQQKVMQRMVDKQAAELYAEMRKNAVIVKTGR